MPAHGGIVARKRGACYGCTRRSAPPARAATTTTDAGAIRDELAETA
jgi:hypothetical protein